MAAVDTMRRVVGDAGGGLGEVDDVSGQSQISRDKGIRIESLTEMSEAMRSWQLLSEQRVDLTVKSVMSKWQSCCDNLL